MRIFESMDDFIRQSGEELGVSNWILLDQARVNQFAEVTEDRQWIHLDVERASQSELGGTIVHGFLLLSLIPALGGEIYCVEGIPAKLNYGLDRCRFITPVRVGSEVRVSLTLASVTSNFHGWRVVVDVTLEVKGQEKPALVARTLAQYNRPE